MTDRPRRRDVRRLGCRWGRCRWSRCRTGLVTRDRRRGGRRGCGRAERPGSLRGQARVDQEAGHGSVREPRVGGVGPVGEPLATVGAATEQPGRVVAARRAKAEIPPAPGTAIDWRRTRGAAQLRVHERLSEEVGSREIPLGPQIEQLERATRRPTASRERALERLLPQRRASEVTSCVHRLLLLREPAELADGLAHMRYAAQMAAIRPRAPRWVALGPPLAGHGWSGDSASMSSGVGAEAPIPARARSCIASCRGAARTLRVPLLPSNS